MGAGASVDYSSVSDATLRDKLNEVKKLYNQGSTDSALEKAYSIAFNYKNNAVLRDEKFRFFEFLTSILNTVSTGVARTNALYSIMMLSLVFDHSTRLCSPELKLVTALVNLLNSTTGDDRLNVSKCIGNIGKITDTSPLKYFIYFYSWKCLAL